VRGWSRCFTEGDVRRHPDDGRDVRAVPEDEVQIHLAAAVGDLEALHFGLVQAGGPSAALRHESRLGDQPEGGEPAYPSIARGDRDAVPVRDLLGRQLLLVEGDQDAEGVVVEEGLSVLVIEQKFFGQQLRSGGFAAVRWRSERHAADSGSLD